MREMKFRFRVKHGDGVVGVYYLTLEQYNKWWANGEILSRDEYAGLKDKNGKDIYEGDIVRHRNGGKYYNDKVHWEYSGFYVGSWTPGELHEFSDIEVIGNIYESPELLEDSP